VKKESLIWLTKEVYRLTLLFPKKEPLRYKMRELADDILADFLRFNSLAGNSQTNHRLKEGEELVLCIMENIEVLDSFFSVAQEQNWVDASDLLVIDKEYVNLKDDLERDRLKLAGQIPIFLEGEIQAKNEPVASFESQPRFSSFSERHEKILTFLRENGRAQVWQLKQILPEISKRTLRRDFEYLVKEGIIERIGERNDTFYQVKINQS
jgi:hypothetical protein